MMSDSIVVVRMVRNMRYKLTYIRIFEEYMEPDPGANVMGLLQSLIQAQQMAVSPLSSYLRKLGVNVQEIELDEKLLKHAASRDNTRSRLRFIYEGLSRAVSWYRMQLVDKQMTADPDLKQLLFQLGEIDSAQMWRTEVTMAMMGISSKARQKEYDDQRRPDPTAVEGWRPSLVEDVGQTQWEGQNSTRWQQPYRGSGRER
jgi:hypothetical protein